VVVVEFFDYQCAVCARQARVLDAVMNDNPRVRFVFKAWPILAPRWETSLTAATVALNVWQQKGAVGYRAYHNAVFASGHTEGLLTDDDIVRAAGAARFDISRVVDVRPALEDVDTLARAVGLRGTPALVVMPVLGATPRNTTVIPGGVDARGLQQAINKATGN